MTSNGPASYTSGGTRRRTTVNKGGGGGLIGGRRTSSIAPAPNTNIHNLAGGGTNAITGPATAAGGGGLSGASNSDVPTRRETISGPLPARDDNRRHSINPSQASSTSTATSESKDLVRAFAKTWAGPSSTTSSSTNLGSFVPAQDVVGTEFGKEYSQAAPNPAVQEKQDSVKKVDEEALDHLERGQVLEEVIHHNANTPLGWRDNGSFSCMRAAPPPCHGFSVYGVHFSPSSTYLASCGHDGSVCVWEVSTMELKKKMTGHKSFALRCQWTADEQYIITVAVEEVIVWYFLAPQGAHSAKVSITMQKGLSYIELSPDNKMLVLVGEERTIHVWDFEKTINYKPNNNDTKRTKELTKEFLTAVIPKNMDLAHESKITQAAFAPHSKYLLTASYDHTVRLWDVRKQGSHVRTFKGHTGHVLGLSWHANTKMFASCSQDKTVCIWRLDSLTPIHVLKGHESIVYACTFLPDSNRILSLGSDSNWILWNTMYGTVVKRGQHVQFGPKVCLSINKRGTVFAVGGTDQRRPITIWEADLPPPWYQTILRMLFSWLPDTILAVKRVVDESSKPAVPTKKDPNKYSIPS